MGGQGPGTPTSVVAETERRRKKAARGEIL